MIRAIILDTIALICLIGSLYALYVVAWAWLG
jgi:hypothetical protein